MTTLRFPVAGVWGAVCTVALFALLAHLVNVPMDVPKPLDGRIVDFTHLRSETPVETKRQQKPTRPPLVTPGQLKIGPPTVTGDPPTTLVIPAVAVVTHGDGGLRLGTDRDVVPLVRVAVDYPPRALRDKTEGWVKVQFTITATGAVKDAFVVASDPRNVFEDAALKAIARWRYNPRIDGGVPVERVGVQTLIRFQLENTL